MASYGVNMVPVIRHPQYTDCREQLECITHAMSGVACRDDWGRSSMQAASFHRLGHLQLDYQTKLCKAPLSVHAVRFVVEPSRPLSLCMDSHFLPWCASVRQTERKGHLAKMETLWWAAPLTCELILQSWLQRNVHKDGNIIRDYYVRDVNNIFNVKSPGRMNTIKT